MKIYINVKVLGKKNRALEPVAYEVSDYIKNLRELLQELVRIEVKKYNSKETNMQTVAFGDEQTLEVQASSGKVGFGRICSEKKADPEKAVENALQSFTDGLIRVIWNEKELTHLEEELTLSEGDVFTLIRMTFLTGRLW